MAEYSATIYGTEHDKVNCSFYYKIGACRHGEKCSRKHIKPSFSQTVLLPNFYQNPKLNPNETLNPRQLQESFDLFYKDIFLQFAKIGDLEDIIICENTNDHLNGNVYIKYRYEEDASKAVIFLNGEWYNSKPVYAELSPVSNFQDANCRQHELDNCNRGGHCNFMHVKKPSGTLVKDLFKSLRKSYWLKELKELESSEQKSDQNDYQKSEQNNVPVVL